MSRTTSSADHRWDRVNARGHARLHNGHVFSGPVYSMTRREHRHESGEKLQDCSDPVLQMCITIRRTKATPPERKGAEKELGEQVFLLGSSLRRSTLDERKSKMPTVTHTGGYFKMETRQASPSG